MNLLGRWLGSRGGSSESLKLYDFGWMVRTKKKSFSKLYIRIFNSRHSDNITTASKNERFGGGDDFHCRLLCLRLPIREEHCRNILLTHRTLEPGMRDVQDGRNSIALFSFSVVRRR